MSDIDNIFDCYDFCEFGDNIFSEENGEESLEPERMADEEYLKKIRTRLKRYVSRAVSTGEICGTEELKSRADREIKKYNKTYSMSEKEHIRVEKEIEELNERLKGPIDDMIKEMVFTYHKEKAIFNLNKNIAEAEISKLMDKSGYDYYIYYNRNYAKVHIKITSLKKAVLYLKYGSLDEQIPKILETLDSMKRIYETFGPGSGIISLYSFDREHFEYAREEREERESWQDPDD